MKPRLNLFKQTFFLFFMILISCNNNEIQQYNFIMKEYPNTLNYKYYIILPNEPCSSCRSVSIEFVKQTIKQNNQQIKVFFLNSNRELLANRISINILTKKNIIINPMFLNDSSQLFNYPTIFYLKGNRIIKIIKQNSKNPFAFHFLLHTINNQHL